MLLVSSVRHTRSRSSDSVISVRKSMAEMMKRISDRSPAIGESFDRLLPLSDDCVMVLLELRLFKNLAERKRSTGKMDCESLATVFRSYAETVRKMDEHLAEILTSEDVDAKLRSLRRDAKRQIKLVRRSKSLLTAQAQMNDVVSTVSELIRLISKRDNEMVESWLEQLPLPYLLIFVKQWWRILTQLGIFAFERSVDCNKAKVAMAKANSIPIRFADEEVIDAFSSIITNDMVNDGLCHTARLRVGVTQKIVITALKVAVVRLESKRRFEVVRYLRRVIEDLEESSDAKAFLGLDAAALSGDVVSAKIESRKCACHIKACVLDTLLVKDHLESLDC